MIFPWPPKKWLKLSPPHFDQFWGGGSLRGFNHTPRTSRGDSQGLVGEQTEKPGDEMVLGKHDFHAAVQLWDKLLNDDVKWRNTFEMQQRHAEGGGECLFSEF